MKLGTAHQERLDGATGQDPRPPQVPGYEVLGRIGRGDSEVWKAEGPGGFQAALRVIRVGPDAHPDDVRGLEQRHRTRHPNLLAATGSWRSPGALVLATELPDRSLWDRYREACVGHAHGIPRDELIEYLAQAAKGIDFANGHGPAVPAPAGAGPGRPLVVVSPTTIVFVGGGIKVSDVEADWQSTPPGPQPNGPGAVEAPPRASDYAAPERASGRDSRQADQYSLAITYYQMRTGKWPFPDRGDDGSGDPPGRAPVLFALPALERPAIARALHPDPNRRWPSCQAFVAALRAAADAADALATAAFDDSGPNRDGRSGGHFTSRPLWAAAALAAIAVPLYYFYFYDQPSPLRRVGPALNEAARRPPHRSKRPSDPRSPVPPAEPAPVVADRAPVEPAYPRHRPTTYTAVAPTLPDPNPMPVAPTADDSDPVPTLDGPVIEPARVAGGKLAPTPEAETPGPEVGRLASPSDAGGPLRSGWVRGSLVNRPSLRPGIDAASARPEAPIDPVSASNPAVPGLSAGAASLVIPWSWLTATETAVAATATATAVTAPAPAPAPTIRLEVPEALSVEVGRTTSLPVTIATQGINGPVEVRLSGLPSGVTSASRTLDARAGAAEGQGGKAGTSHLIPIHSEPNSPEGEAVALLVVSSGPTQAESLVKVTVLPAPAVAARRRGDALLRREDYVGAIAAYDQAVALNPSDALALHGRGLSYYGKGDLDPALADIGAALRLRPETPTALNNRGLIRLARGDHAAAVTDFDEAIRLDPRYAVVRYNRGRAYAESGAADMALADFDEAIRLDPGFAKAFKARADVRAKKGDRELALADYDEAVRLRPDDPASLNNRGLLLFALGHSHRAIADFDEAIRLSPRYAVVRYNRGRVYAYLGDAVEALASFDQALRLDPNFSRAAQARADLLKKHEGEPLRDRPGAVPGPSTGSTVAARREPPRRATPSEPPQ